MSAGSTLSIGPVSVRYAAQIQELLYTHAVQRAAADQEIARQNDAAEKAARLQPAVDETPAVKIDANTSHASSGSHADETPAEAAEPLATPGEIVDVHA